MLPVVLFAAAWLVLKHYFQDGSFDLLTGNENLKRMFNPSMVRQRAPHLIRDDVQEKSFAANQSHHSIRPPFGPNPHAHEIQAHEFLDWPLYRARYTQEIHRMTVKNQDWRLDPAFNSALNNFSNWHMPENYEDLILHTKKLSSDFPDFDQQR